LAGAIDQLNPPKIWPFATDLEMYLSLGKGERKTGRGEGHSSKTHGLGRINSSARSAIVPNRSFVLATAMYNLGMDNVQFAPLVAHKIKPALLDIPEVGDGGWEFQITPEEFLNLAAT
jgi:hypothetical protein